MRQALGPGALGKPRESGWRGRWEWGSGWGTRVNPWLFHFNLRGMGLIPCCRNKIPHATWPKKK